MINIGEKELCFLPYSLSLLSDWISEKPADGRLSRLSSSLSIESELSLPSQMKFLSLLSDSNQRPRDYKSRALAN